MKRTSVSDRMVKTALIATALLAGCNENGCFTPKGLAEARMRCGTDAKEDRLLLGVEIDCEIKRKLVMDTNLADISDAITTKLFRTCRGGRADRLVLVDDHNRDLGGWCFNAVRDVILKTLVAEMNGTKKLNTAKGR